MTREQYSFMFRTEKKTYCINCKKEIGQVQIKQEIVSECKVCGFYTILKLNVENNSFDNFSLEIYLPEKQENTVWENVINDKPVLSCPFCTENMKASREVNFETDKNYKCEKCGEVFSVEYL